MVTRIRQRILMLPLWLVVSDARRQKMEERVAAQHSTLMCCRTSRLWTGLRSNRDGEEAVVEGMEWCLHSVREKKF